MAHSKVDQLLAETFATRRRAWSEWGEVDNDVLTHLLNPTFAGGPRWPALRQAFAIARRGNSTLIASDGLSDPFDDEEDEIPPLNGFRLEMFALTDEPLKTVAGSWLFDLVWQMSQQAAHHGGIADLIDELGLISSELYDVSIPAEHVDAFVNEEGRVGVLIGVDHPPVPRTISGPLSPIRLLNVKLLTLPELEFVARGGEAARLELAQRFQAGSEPQASALGRPSVV